MAKSKHPPGPCGNPDCYRPLCEGYRLGYDEGYMHGWGDGYSAGSAAAGAK